MISKIQVDRKKINRMEPNLRIKGQDKCHMGANRDITCSEFFKVPNQLIFGSSGALSPIQYAPMRPNSPAHVGCISSNLDSSKGSPIYYTNSSQPSTPRSGPHQLPYGWSKQSRTWIPHLTWNETPSQFWQHDNFGFWKLRKDESNSKKDSSV